MLVAKAMLARVAGTLARDAERTLPPRVPFWVLQDRRARKGLYRMTWRVWGDEQPFPVTSTLVWDVPGKRTKKKG